MALEYGEEGKKIYLIPNTISKGGIGQYRKDEQSTYIDMFTKIVKIKRAHYAEFKSLEIDGTNGGQNLGSFNSEYHKIIRGMLEGRLTLQILAANYDEVTAKLSDITGIATINMLGGALEQEQLRYTSQDDYKTLSGSGIIFQDEEYYNEENEDNIISVMNLFKEYQLYILPLVRKETWDNIWVTLSFIRDFF